MEAAPQLFEGMMILCFGISWPTKIWKTLKTKTVAGISSVFLWLVFVGYLAGILFKISEAQYRGALSPLIILYVLNAVMVGSEIMLYYKFRIR